MRHDNCKNCIRGCEHAGTDREFCIPTGKESCKKVGTKQSAIIKKFAERVKLAFYQEFDEIIPSIMAVRIDEISRELENEK